MLNKMSGSIRVLQLCCLSTALIHFYSFFFYLPFAFYGCISIGLILFCCIFFNINILQKQRSAHILTPSEPVHFYDTWSKSAQIFNILLFLYALFTLIVSIQNLDHQQVTFKNNTYLLEQRGTFIREATVQEYQLYQKRVVRLFSSYLWLFSFSFLNLLRFKK